VSAKILAKISLILICGVCSAQEQESVEELFKKLVAAPSKEYVEYVVARDAFLARDVEVRPILKRILETSDNWQERVTAQIIQGWLENPELYAELWQWEAPDNRCRNPYPFMREQTRQKFSEASEKAVPIMMELIWKKGQKHYGVLCQLLCEWKIERALPVIAESMALYPSYDWITAPAMSNFGEKASPYIIKALKKTERYRSEGLIKALGYTGGEKAAEHLCYQLKKSPRAEDKEEAAVSLGRLKKFALLRKAIPDMADGYLPKLLDVLGQDKSAQNREFLYEYATNYEYKTTSTYNEIRLSAVKAILQEATEEDISKVCEIAPQEPHDYTRSCIYMYLSRLNNPLVREVILKALEDKSKQVRIRAIDGLADYEDEEVTQMLINMLGDSNECRREAILVLRSRRSPLIAEAAIGLLKDEDPEILRWTAEALERNPTAKAAEALMGLLDSDDEGVRFRAARALGKIGGEKVRIAIKEAYDTEQDEWVKEEMERLIKDLSRREGN
jgi:hypothetical protein